LEDAIQTEDTATDAGTNHVTIPLPGFQGSSSFVYLGYLVKMQLQHHLP
jgi:hypothetical protein